MPLDLTPDQLAEALNVVRLAPLRHERTRLCRLASVHMNAMVRNSMRGGPDGKGDDEAAFEHQRAAEQLLTEAERISREIEDMEAGI